MWLEVDNRRVFAATGRRVFNPHQPVTVLVHGAGGDHSVWDVQAEGLAVAGRAVLAFDLPGHGQSEGPALATIDAMADWLILALAAAGAKDACFAGHSMGALVVMAAAARHPWRVTTIALLGTAATMPVHEGLLKAATDDLASASAMISTWAFAAEPPPDAALIESNRALLARSAPGVLHTDLAACNAFIDGTRKAATIGCPTTVVIGDQDRMCPSKASLALTQAIPGAKSVMLEKCGHMMMAEYPDQILDVLIRAC